MAKAEQADRTPLQPAHVKFVEDASGKLFQRLVNASIKGDPAARQALDMLGK